MFLLIAIAIVTILAWVGYFRAKKREEEWYQAQRDYLHITRYDNYKG